MYLEKNLIPKKIDIKINFLFLQNLIALIVEIELMEKTEVMLHEALHSMIKSSDSFSEVNSHIDTIMIKLNL